MTPRALRSALAVDSQYAPFTRCLVDNQALDVAAPRLARLVTKTRLSGPGEIVRWLSDGRQRRVVRRRIGAGLPLLPCGRRQAHALCMMRLIRRSPEQRGARTARPSSS